MKYDWPTHLLAAARHMAVLLSARMLPFTACVIFRSKSTLGQRASWAALYLLPPTLSCYLGAGRAIIALAGGFAYYLFVSLWVNYLQDRMARRRLGRGGLLILLYAVYLLVPGFVLPNLALSTFLVVGCELAMSSFSYCVETSRRGGARASLREVLFFLFVNPTILYTLRGARSNGPVGFRGWLRFAAGVAVMATNVAVIRPTVHQMRIVGGPLGLPGLTAMSTALCGLLSFCAIYAAHSGLASIQIGLMEQIGWSVPERYRYPLLSTSPMEFWRRWNTYVRVWLEAYVFLPLGRFVATMSRARSAQLAAAVATLIASGAIHGAVIFAGRQKLEGVDGELLFFLSAGAIVVAWRFCSLATDRVRRLLRPAWAARLELVARVSARVALGGMLVAAANHWR